MHDLATFREGLNIRTENSRDNCFCVDATRGIILELLDFGWDCLGDSPPFCGGWINRIPRPNNRFVTTTKARSITMKILRTCGIAVLVLVIGCGLAAGQTPFSAGQWTRATTPPQPGVGHALLLTDGSVLAISGNCNAGTGRWYRLVPDSTGSYVNGTWKSGGTLPAGYNPLYFASAVLPSGNVIIMGGEYNACVGAETTLGAMYFARANHWTSVAAPPGWSSVGDAASVVLPNGKFMLANCCTSDEAIATVGTSVTWTPTGTGKADANSEEGWLLLPGGNVLTVDANNLANLTNSEIYNTKTGTWATAGSTVVRLDDTSTPTNSHEVGPMVLRPDGTVFAAGATTNNAVYTIATGKWTAAPKFGGALDVADGPAALLPDGNVLLDASPGIYKNGSVFFEWDGSALNSVPGVPNGPGEPSYAGNMLVLPTGQILFTDGSADVEIYTSSGSPCSGCAPSIASVASTLALGSVNNLIHGMQFNGLSQGGAYGDDAQAATNFPLIRITDSTGAVVYCRTHNFSTMGVATGSKIVSAQFDVPSSVATGSATLEVVANGIASSAMAVTIN